MYTFWFGPVILPRAATTHFLFSTLTPHTDGTVDHDVWTASWDMRGASCMKQWNAKLSM